MSNGPVSSRIRSARRSLQRRRASRQLAGRRRRERIDERIDPYRQELNRIDEELAVLVNEFSGGPRSNAEAKQEGFGALLANRLDVPAQRADFDGDGDDDLAVFFGVDQDTSQRFNSPFAAFDQPRRSSEEEREPFDPFKAMEEFEERLPP